MWIFEGLLISYHSCICQVHIMNKIEVKKKQMSKFPINLCIFFLSLWTLIWHISVHVYENLFISTYRFPWNRESSWEFVKQKTYGKISFIEKTYCYMLQILSLCYFWNMIKNMYAHCRLNLHFYFRVLLTVKIYLSQEKIGESMCTILARFFFSVLPAVKKNAVI